MKKPNWVKTLYKLILLQLLLYVDACAMSNSENFLEIVTNSENASYYISFNDVDVFTEASDAPVKQTIPVNQWAVNGDNILLVSVNFRNNEPLELAKNSSLKVELFLRTKDQNKELSHLITEFNIKPSKNMPGEVASSSLESVSIDSSSYKQSTAGDIKIGKWDTKSEDSWIDYKQSIRIDLGLPEWEFLSAENLGNIDNMPEDDFFALSDELFEEYKNIWNMMSNKDLDKVLEATELRSREMNQAFYLEPGSKEADMKKSLSSAFSNEDLFLDKLIENDAAQLSILANGKVLNIKVAGTDEPPIYFSHKRGSFTRLYDFYFMKKNGKWIIIR